MPGQRKPHCDGFCDYAGLVYLNPSEQCFGGTSFWRHRSTGLELALGTSGSVPIRAQAVVPTEPEPAEPTLTDDISDPGTGYLIASNETWELTQVIPMEYNRFVLYSSNIFHSPLYDERDFGSTLEARRLTQNFYFVKRSVGQ